MSLLGGFEIRIDAEMYLRYAARKPRAASFFQLVGLFDFGHPEYTGIKIASAFFFTARHCQST